MDKKSLRRNVKAATLEFISSGGVERRLSAEKAIWNALEALPSFAAASTVLVYSALPDEVQTAEFIGRWAGRKRIVLPVVDGENLLLREMPGGKAGGLVSGYRGILEPGPDCKEVRPGEIDFAIIPGVAFTADGWRLGRGRGYYDRLLPQLHCPRVGTAYPTQIVPSMPLDPWDIRLDAVIGANP